MAPPLPPGLMDDLIGEILLRLPPADPACLVRASLVSKSWRSLVLDCGFLRDYRAFHRTPPMLGFFHDKPCEYGVYDIFVPGFVATTTMPVPPTLPQPAASAGPGHGSAAEGTMYSCRTLDCRHGRVLLHTVTVGEPSATLTVWDPVTGDHESFSPPADINRYEDLTAAVLCASAAASDGGGCDHLECSAGARPFLVVIAGVSHGEDYDQDCVAWARVYSSETARWSAPTTLDDVESSVDPALPSLLAAGAVYFMLDDGRRILKYDLESGGALSVMKAPPLPQLEEPNMIFATARDGELGAATVEGYSLHLWSWDAGVEEWARVRVIELNTMIPISSGDPSLTKFDLVGSAQGAGMIFISASANDGDHRNIFTVELKSGHITMTSKTRRNYGNIFPLMSFGTPAANS